MCCHPHAHDAKFDVPLLVQALRMPVAYETAVSIAAEIVASRYSGTGLPLATVCTAIHRPDSAASL